MTDGRDDGPNEPTGSSGGPRHDEDALWREIVAHYGDEPQGDLADGASARSADEREPRDEGPPSALTPPETPRETTHWFTAEEDPDEGYTPPPPPPLPRPVGLRLVAWIGIFGVPVLVLVLLLTGISLPPWGGLLCLAWFVGGFVYLVATMRKGPGTDEWDDGARL